MMGPNTATGHLSVIYTTECQINFAIRVIRPLLRTLYPSRLSNLNLLEHSKPDTVEVTTDAERRDNEWIQTEVKKFVWASGCQSWYVDEETGRNTLLYPDWQWKYWLRSIFIPFKTDFAFKTSEVSVMGKNQGQRTNPYTTTALTLSGVGIIVGIFLASSDRDIAVSKVKDVVRSCGHHLNGLIAPAR